ncbi:MAG: LysR family transcriptional regulator [Humidesulfovibrio sp.]|uniref:LysR family transcriptional regulator n=1 Tax=Humidesulfovibrio sp. TaxID=2910988 RepID=UPI0027324BDF|nr:LysR family transcriptional regulator [Humidesulfovibrio sp.]MDP2849059.1 LysR family transcriptional regulator [Humidesulfovibrio sp.]
MELYQLRTFVAVAEEAHLTRAAERLFISQPAVSAHIKALEEELGVALFTRSSRGMQLTREGQALRAQAEAALKSVGELFTQARALRENLTGELKVALNTDPELLRMRRLMDALRVAHPKLQVHLPQSASNLIIEEVRAGRLDGGFAFVAEPASANLSPELTCLHLDTTSLHVVAPPAWAERLNACTWSDLAQEAWVWFTDACPCRSLLERQLLPYVNEVNKVAVTDYEGTLKALVTSGAGLGLMHRDEALGWERTGEVCIWPHDKLPIGICFLTRSDRASDPAILAVSKALREVWGLTSGESAPEAG